MKALSPRGARTVRSLLLLIAIAPNIGVARAYLDSFDEPGNQLDPWTDAITYLAAGERLNAGHDLYRLGPGDREVLIFSDTFTAPLLSPPPIAVLWRPIAAVPFGLTIWVLACWIAVLGTILFLVAKVGWPAAFLAAALAPAIGLQLAVANVSAFFPAMLVAAWLRRTSLTGGLLIGIMTALKVSPGTMIGWLVSTRRVAPIAAAMVAIGVLLILGLVGAGPASYVEYVDVAAATHPSSSSLSGMTGLPWLSFAVLIGTTLISAALVTRPKLSFGIAVVGLVFGNPAFYPSSLTPLLALAAPLLDGSISLGHGDADVYEAPEAVGKRRTGFPIRFWARTNEKWTRNDRESSANPPISRSPTSLVLQTAAQPTAEQTDFPARSSVLR